MMKGFFLKFCEKSFLVTTVATVTAVTTVTTFITVTTVTVVTTVTIVTTDYLLDFQSCWVQLKS